MYISEVLVLRFVGGGDVGSAKWELPWSGEWEQPKLGDHTYHGTATPNQSFKNEEKDWVKLGRSWECEIGAQTWEIIIIATQTQSLKTTSLKSGEMGAPIIIRMGGFSNRIKSCQKKVAPGAWKMKRVEQVGGLVYQWETNQPDQPQTGVWNPNGSNQ